MNATTIETPMDYREKIREAFVKALEEADLHYLDIERAVFCIRALDLDKIAPRPEPIPERVALGKRLATTPIDQWRFDGAEHVMVINALLAEPVAAPAGPPELVEPMLNARMEMSGAIACEDEHRGWDALVKYHQVILYAVEFFAGRK